METGGTLLDRVSRALQPQAGVLGHKAPGIAGQVLKSQAATATKRRKDQAN